MQISKWDFLLKTELKVVRPRLRFSTLGDIGGHVKKEGESRTF